MRLKTDILTSTNLGLMNDKTNLTNELRETRTLYRNYEAKCTEVMDELQITITEYNDLKRRMINNDETTKIREALIDS